MKIKEVYMVKKWDYAELSKAAKAAGGPEKYLNILEEMSKNAGKREMYPWIGIVAICSSVTTMIAIKAVEQFKVTRKQSQEEISIAKRELTKGIEEYKIVHENLEKNETETIRKERDGKINKIEPTENFRSE